MNETLVHKTYNKFSWLFFQLINRVKNGRNQLNQNNSTREINQQVKEKNYLVWRNLGNRFILESKYEQAVVAYNRATQHQPDKDEAWLQKGKILAHLGEFSPAMVAIEQAIALNPNNYQAWYEKAKVLQALNQNSQAHTCLVQCLGEFTEMVAQESHVYTLPWYR